MALSVVGCAVTLLTALSPSEGWQWSGFDIRLEHPASWRAWLTPQTPQLIIPRLKPEDVSDLLAQYDSGWTAAIGADALLPDAAASPSPNGGTVDMMDSTGAGTQETVALLSGPAPAQGDTSSATHSAQATPPTDSTHAARRKRNIPAVIPNASALPEVLRLTIPESARPAFARLFAQLDQHGEVDVLHYGDSQIEGDRISGVMRNAWQQRWGGHGPGLQAAIPLVQSFAVRQQHFGPWKRHTRYGRRDTTDVDERYGLMACYASLSDSTPGPHCLGLAPEPRNHPQFAQWRGIRLWHDTVTTDCIVSLDDRNLDTLRAGTPAAYLDLFPAAPDTSTGSSNGSLICFSGTAPRLFALQPLGAGVQWHGVPMRGSSGTLFRKLERTTLSRQLQTLGPELVILQYGGNVVPHCQDTAQADRFGGWFASQIRLFKRLLPQAAILVIGPSDMAEKRGVAWTSFPQLGAVRDALKRTAMAEGAGYWDLLEVMGGMGSMPAWVDSEPALAGPDHVHFTPLGAKRVGTLLDRAFLGCYSDWKRHWSSPAPSSMPKRAAAPVSGPPPPAPLMKSDGTH